MSRSSLGLVLAAAAAGCVTGIFGAGGGMVLVPCLTAWGGLEPEEVFPASLCVMLPICLVCLWFSAPLPWDSALPYLLGGAIGGVLAGWLGRWIPTVWLHRILGIFILWGGIRYLWG